MLTLSTSGGDLCKDMAPSSGRFLWCTSTSSLDEICQADKHATFTWWVTQVFFCTDWDNISTCDHSESRQFLSTSSVTEPISATAAQPRTGSCSREFQTDTSCCVDQNPLFLDAVTMFVVISGEGSHCCDCTAFCKSASKKRTRILSSKSYLDMCSYIFQRC